MWGKTSAAIAIVAMLGVLTLLGFQQFSSSHDAQDVPAPNQTAGSVAAITKQKVPDSNSAFTLAPVSANYQSPQVSPAVQPAQEDINQKEDKEPPELSDHPTLQELKDISRQRSYERAKENGRLDEFYEQDARIKKRKEDRKEQSEMMQNRRDEMLQWGKEMHQWHREQHEALAEGRTPPPMPERLESLPPDN